MGLPQKTSKSKLPLVLLLPLGPLKYTSGMTKPMISLELSFPNLSKNNLQMHNSKIIGTKTGVFCCKTSKSFHGYGGGSSGAIGRYGVAVKEGPFAKVERSSASAKSTDRIGIVKFYRGKNIFITGGTGLLGKAIIEKLLREIPDIGKVYVLIKAANEEAAMARLKSEIIGSELFERLRGMHKKSESRVFSSKLVPVIGDISSPNLGMDSKTMEIISREIDVIINSAGNTEFFDRYDILINTNTQGPLRLMSFAKKCEKLQLFVQISTMYVNRKIKGRIPEKPLCEGKIVKMEKDSTKIPYYYGRLDIEAEIKLTEDSSPHFDEKETLKMKELGIQRATLYGWRNTYEFTKAMGEMVVDSSREDIPVIIICPSVIESSFSDPHPGWIQGNRMLDPVLLSYGKGHLPGLYMNPNGILDVIPVDMVVNTIIAATAKHGINSIPSLTVYQVGSSSMNLLSFFNIFAYAYEHFSSFPFVDVGGNAAQIEEMKFLSSMDELLSFLPKQIAGQQRLMVHSRSISGHLERRCKAIVDNVLQLIKLYQPYMFGEGRNASFYPFLMIVDFLYDNDNVRELMNDMSIEERRSFNIDIESLDWRNYMLDIHLNGIRKHVWKGK